MRSTSRVSMAASRSRRWPTSRHEERASDPRVRTPSGLLNALFAYRNEYVSKDALARLACEIEIDRCSEPIGKQDQYAGVARRPEPHSLPSRRIRCRSIRVICAPDAARTAGGVDPGLLHGPRPERLDGSWPASGENIAANRPLMRRMVQLAFDLKNELESGRLESVGSILDENWCLKKQMGEGLRRPDRRVVRRPARRTARWAANCLAPATAGS